MVREAVYEGAFGTPKTQAGLRAVPLAEGVVDLLRAWSQRTTRTGPDDLVFSTISGKPISPNNVLRRWVFPACSTLGRFVARRLEGEKMAPLCAALATLLRLGQMARSQFMLPDRRLRLPVNGAKFKVRLP
jgi:hypothetical protein